jgi:hypothetical protein
MTYLKNILSESTVGGIVIGLSNNCEGILRIGRIEILFFLARAMVLWNAERQTPLQNFLSLRPAKTFLQCWQSPCVGTTLFIGYCFCLFNRIARLFMSSSSFLSMSLA